MTTSPITAHVIRSDAEAIAVAHGSLCHRSQRAGSRATLAGRRPLRVFRQRPLGHHCSTEE